MGKRCKRANRAHTRELWESATREQFELIKREVWESVTREQLELKQRGVRKRPNRGEVWESVTIEQIELMKERCE